MIISKVFYTYKQAEKFQNKLYGQYSKVEMISAPTYSQEGEYIWKCQVN